MQVRTARGERMPQSSFSFIPVFQSVSDSHRSGLEADQKTIAAHGCYALTVTTALTAQNTLGVNDIHATPPEFVGKQIAACLDDVRTAIVKIGEQTDRVSRRLPP